MRRTFTQIFIYPPALSLIPTLWPVIAASTHRQDVVATVKNYWRDASPNAVNQMIVIAGTTADADLRSAAIWALSSIHSKETLPFLGTLLGSTSVTEQLQGMYGISAFVDGCPARDTTNVVSMAYLNCPGTSYSTAETLQNLTFRQGTTDQHEAVLSFWRTWWSGHQELH